jgi:hypothetical protein
LTYSYGEDGKKQMHEASDFADIVKSERKLDLRLRTSTDIVRETEVKNAPINSILFCHTTRPNKMETIEEHIQDEIGRDIQQISVGESSSLPDDVRRKDDIVVYGVNELENPPINVGILGRGYIKYDEVHDEFVSYRFGHDSLVPMLTHIYSMLAEQQTTQQTLEPYLE